jgi:hypothetical protein
VARRKITAWSRLPDGGGLREVLQLCRSDLITWADMVLEPSVAGLFKWRQFKPELILLALRPDALRTRTPHWSAAAMSMFTGPPRETAINLSKGIRSSICPKTGANCITSTSALSTNPTISSGSTRYSLEPGHVGLGATVRRRLIRKGQAHGADRGGVCAGVATRFLELLRQHEVVTENRDIRHQDQRRTFVVSVMPNLTGFV